MELMMIEETAPDTDIFSRLDCKPGGAVPSRSKDRA
jgi:hypothetical protein